MRGRAARDGDNGSGEAAIAGEMCTCCSERGPTQCQLVQCLAVTAGRPAAPEREGHVLQVQERVGHMFQVQKGWGWGTCSRYRRGWGTCSRYRRDGGGAHAPGTGDGAGDIKRCERSGRNVMPLMSTLCMHTEKGAVPCTLTAATSLHAVTHSVISAQHDYSYMYV